MDDGPKVKRVEEHFMGTPDGGMAPVDDLMDEIGSLERAKEKDIDDHISSSAILGVDITEVYSSERANDVAGRHGLTAGSSLDLTNTWDVTKPEHRRAARKNIKAEDPYLIIGSPPCTLFSLLQELNINNNKNKKGWMDEFNRRKVEAIEHIDFCCMMYEYQVRRGNHFLH